MSKVSQPLSLNNKNYLRESSFSSYLNSSQKTINLRKLEDKSASPNFIFTPPKHLYYGRKNVEDGEIGVFGAEKYFNGRLDREEDPRFAKNRAINPRHKQQPHEPVNTSPMKPKIQPGTSTPTSVHSDSSWDSKSALLQRVLMKTPPLQRKTKKRNGKSFLARLGCACTCDNIDTDGHGGERISKKTVKEEPVLQNEPDKARLNSWVMEEVQCKKMEDHDGQGQGGIGLMREDCFSFPVLINPKHLQEQEDNGERKSLEVFGIGCPEIQENLDNVSESSSDLFEIESFTNHHGNSSPLVLERQESDGGSMSTFCYEPSEASIAWTWSVVTASLADYPVASDCNDAAPPAASVGKARKPSKINAKHPAGNGTEKQHSPSQLLSCKSKKSVMVAGEAHMTIGKDASPHPRRSRAGGL